MCIRDRDDRLNAIEDKIITRTEELINSPLAFKSPMEAVKANNSKPIAAALGCLRKSQILILL
ncbi:MAG: hypothetical protein EBX53_11710 [Betaproteobacteria bacterium]|nr:hypothetical protein [Betaproteobacteria bacterium]